MIFQVKWKSFLKSIEQRFFKKKNIKNKSDFINILKKRDLEYDNIMNKLYIEALWNQLFIVNFQKILELIKRKMRKNILIQFQK